MKMNTKKLYLYLSFLLPLQPLFDSQSQSIDDNTVQVLSFSGQTLNHPWAGGMNSCQYGLIDLNLDGIKDLVVFDRTGNRLMPFLSNGSQGIAGYTFAPEYAELFPPLSAWAIFADYDGDGREDIFTYSPGFAGMKVYRNVSVSRLEFRLQVYPYLTSFQGGGYVNILVTYADYPGLFDLDGDGDLDILTFYGLGSFVEMHRNMSVEKFGHADSLDFERTSYCWGFFAESEESNALTLDTCLGGMGAWGREGMGAWEERHTGSTFQLLDLNGDQLIDLLLGDVDYPNLVALYNGGTADTARITSFEWEFPAGNESVRLFSMPAAFYGDADRDGVPDLLVSPFDPNPFISNNMESSWFYKNYGSKDNPQFVLHSRRFLQEEMIDVGAGAYPVFFDYDNDGLMDLFIGNYGYYDTSYYDIYMMLHTEHTGQLALLKNTGTSQQPAFNWIERDFAGISQLGVLGCIPTFADLDGDGDADMILGREDGTLVIYYNTAGQGEPMQLEFGQANYQGIDVGSFSAPQLFDLDRDGKPDLIIGERGGNLNFYRNTGSLQQPQFTLVTDSLGKVNVTDYNLSLDGYSVPFFYRDAQDEVHLLVGSEQGEIFYFTGIDAFNFTGAYERNDTLSGLIGIQELKTNFGYRVSAALHDLTGDGVPELIVGNFSGGVEYFSSAGPPAVSGLNPENAPESLIRIWPQPANTFINIEGDINIITGIQMVSIFDSRGVEVMSIDNLSRPERMKIELNYLPPGIYFIRIEATLKEGVVRMIHKKLIILN